MNNIMVSVICTVYNHEKYLRKCLDGFVMQKTNFKFEVLIHDDASTDSSADIIREYEKKYPDIIKPIYQTENQHSKGIKISSTYLFPVAKGKYLAFCEGDDYWCDENKLQKQFDIMESNPDCSICVHKVAHVSENGMMLNKNNPNFEISKSHFNCREFFNELFVNSYLPFQTSSYFIRLSMFDYENKPCFWENCDVGDVPIILYCISKGNLCYIDKVLSCYRKNSNGSWSNRIFANIEKRIRHEENIKNMFEEYDDYTNYAYSNEIKKCIVIRQFNIDLLKENYIKCLCRKNKFLFDQMTIKEKFWIILNAYLPHLMKLYKKSKDKNNA